QALGGSRGASRGPISLGKGKRGTLSEGDQHPPFCCQEWYGEWRWTWAGSSTSQGRSAAPQISPVVLWAKTERSALLVELTVPWEEEMEGAHERKRAKYSDLVAECRE